MSGFDKSKTLDRLESIKEEILLDTPCVKCGIKMKYHEFNEQATTADEAFACPDKHIDYVIVYRARDMLRDVIASISISRDKFEAIRREDIKSLHEIYNLITRVLRNQ